MMNKKTKFFTSKSLKTLAILFFTSFFPLLWSAPMNDEQKQQKKGKQQQKLWNFSYTYSFDRSVTHCQKIINYHSWVYSIYVIFIENQKTKKIRSKKKIEDDHDDDPANLFIHPFLFQQCLKKARHPHFIFSRFNFYRVWQYRFIFCFILIFHQKLKIKSIN